MIVTASLTTGVARVAHGMSESVRLVDEILKMNHVGWETTLSVGDTEFHRTKDGPFPDHQFRISLRPLALADAARILRALGPLDVPILLHGQDTSAWPIWTYATEQGLDTRVGLEDMLTRPDGTPASGNADLIEQAQHALRTRPWPPHQHDPASPP